MQLSDDLETNAYGESYLPSINGGLFAQHSARELYEKNLPAQFWDEDTCHLIVGSDSGLLIKQVEQHGVPAGSLYVFIEPPELNNVISQIVDTTLSNHPGILLSHPDLWVTQTEPQGLETYILKKRIFIYPCLAARSTAQDFYSPLLNSVSAALDNRAYTAKLCLVDESLIAQTLKNCSENSLPVTSLAGNFAGRTALVMGAGPSLNDHIEWIKVHRQQLVIFAASRLSNYLIDINLIPDIVVSIDHQNINLELSKSALLFPPEVILLNANHVSPALLSQWAGRHIFVGETVPWLSDLNQENLQERCGPTVTNTAVVVAGELGFSRILLSGVDFCSPANRTTHADSEDLSEQLRRTHQVTTNSGVAAYSNVQMIQAANTLAEQIRRIDDCEIINLAPLACRIVGVSHSIPENLNLSDIPAADRPLPVPIANSAERAAHNLSLLEELQKTLRDLKAIARLCDDAIGFNKKIYKKDKQGNYNLKAKDKLDNIQRKLDEQFGHLSIIIKKVGMRFFIDTMTTRNIETFDDRQLEQQGHSYYRAYKSSTRTLEAIVVDTLQRVQSRLAEEDDLPDINHLIKQWQQDNQPGRATVWQSHHPDSFDALPAEAQTALQTLQHQFAASLKPPELVGPLPNQFWRYRQWFTTYFKAGNNSLIDKLLGDIEQKCGQNRLAPPVLALGRAYLALLQGQNALALEHFKQTDVRDLDQSLLQTLASLALDANDLATAENTLRELSREDNRFQPQYANLLKIQNKVPEAADQYTGYLQQHPDDIDTWLALAQLYREAEESELAQTVYGFVLEQDPDNATAREFMNSR